MFPPATRGTASQPLAYLGGLHSSRAWSGCFAFIKKALQRNSGSGRVEDLAPH